MNDFFIAPRRCGAISYFSILIRNSGYNKKSRTATEAWMANKPKENKKMNEQNLMAAKSGCVFAHTHRMTVRIRWCIVVRKNRLFGQPLASCTYAGSHSRSHYSFMLFVNPAMAKNTFFSRFNSLCLVWLLNKYRLYAFANLHTLAIDTCSGMKKLNWQRELCYTNNWTQWFPRQTNIIIFFDWPRKNNDSQKSWGQQQKQKFTSMPPQHGAHFISNPKYIHPATRKLRLTSTHTVVWGRTLMSF